MGAFFAEYGSILWAGTLETLYMTLVDVYKRQALSWPSPKARSAWPWW